MNNNVLIEVMHHWFRNWGGAPVAQFQYWLEECKYEVTYYEQQ